MFLVVYVMEKFIYAVVISMHLTCKIILYGSTYPLEYNITLVCTHHNTHNIHVHVHDTPLTLSRLSMSALLSNKCWTTLSRLPLAASCSKVRLCYIIVHNTCNSSRR